MHLCAGEHSSGDNSNDNTREFIEFIDNYPTTGQPISDMMLKDMMVLLRDLLHSDILSIFTQLKADIEAIGERVDHVESKMGQFAVAHNELLDAHRDTMKANKFKMTDLEDGSGRNNTKFRVIMKLVLPSNRRCYVQQIISTLLPEREVIVDQAHRLHKTPYLPLLTSSLNHS